MTGKRIVAAFWAGLFLLAWTAYAGQDPSRLHAKRGADDAAEGGHGSDRQREGAPAAASGGEKDAGAVLFESKCSTCHALSRALGKTKNREGWAATVQRMRSNGCQLTDQEAAAIVDHLVKVRGLTPP